MSQTLPRRTGGRPAPESDQRLARHLKVFVAPPTAPSPKLTLSAKPARDARQLPPALDLLPSVHQVNLGRMGQNVTVELAPVPTVPARDLLARPLASFPAQHLSPTTPPRRVLLTARTLTALAPQFSPLSFPMATNVGKREVLATAVQADAVWVEVNID